MSLHQQLFSPGTLANVDYLAEDFSRKQPFRHVIIDHFLEDSFCKQLLADFPDFEDRYALNEMGQPGAKAVRMDLPHLSASYADLDNFLQSREFLDTISRVTGIPDLLYDPDYVGGGTHENRQGQALDPHIDFNYLPKRHWHRRLNLILYLNPTWQEEWGGCLELYADPWRSSENDLIKITPLYNRCVIFETNEISWHGFPPIQLPSDCQHLSRRSIAIYLYTIERPVDETFPSHATVYVPPGLPSEFTAGLTLSGHHVQELRRRFGRMKSQLKFLYERELQFSTHIDSLRQFHVFPLQGFVLQASMPAGYWNDGWAGSELAFAFTATRQATSLVIGLWIPEQLAGQVLDIFINADSHRHVLPAGHCRIIQPLHIEAGSSCEVSIRADRTWIPEQDGSSSDVRQLAYRIIEVLVESTANWPIAPL